MPVDPLTAIRQYLAALIERNRAWDQACENAELCAEAEGYRLVGGGQTGPYDDDGKCDWKITDYRSGAILASGTGTADEFDAAWDKLESSDKPLRHIDRVTGEVPDGSPVPKSAPLPPGLCMALENWVDSDIDEAAKWLDGLRGEDGESR